MSFTESATEQHQWLKKFTGEWRTEIEFSHGPDAPRGISTGTESSHMIGDLWYQGNGASKPKEGEQGGAMVSQFTIGFDSKADEGKGAFVGTFICDQMHRLWTYQGPRVGNTIHLRTSAPSFTDPTKTTQMVDELTLVDDNHKYLVSKHLNEDGTWTEFMWMHYYRVTQ